jgi:hypothetical protein
VNAGLDLATVARRRDDLAIETFDDAVLIWDEAARRLHHLDLLAAIVWEELDGRRDLRAVSEDLSRDFPTSSDQIADDVLGLARNLHDEGLLDVVDLMQNDEDAPRPPA